MAIILGINIDSELYDCIDSNNLPSFIEKWAQKYHDKNEDIYEEYIKKSLTKKLTKDRIRKLYKWKNGREVAIETHKDSIERNYVRCLKGYQKNPPTHSELRNRYLNARDDKSGGPIWNIFYLHVLSKNLCMKMIPDEYPIFDQHVYRAWCSTRPKYQANPEIFKESNDESRKNVFCEYEDYREFYKKIRKDTQEYFDKEKDPCERMLDRALFEFGKSLKRGGRPYKCCT